MILHCINSLLKFFGIACDRPPVMIVMENCPGGSLDKHLLKEKEKIITGERITYLLEAAYGMRYLHHKHCVHRDLAARNCLISAEGVIKIADFGLSAPTDVSDDNEVKMMHVPIRWMAPETLCKEPKFSKKSDVWAYGVLTYEVTFHSASLIQTFETKAVTHFSEIILSYCQLIFGSSEFEGKCHFSLLIQSRLKRKFCIKDIDHES
ncbi:hypothetical protein AB6A40_003257 [Gnathostoma spinigerum]|uniref:Protein kinase domain-containing protein n=1 Tax=Gnathostoma spinigerum TaxID=75299 RepID=A0ABD6E951_9BILA